MKRDRRSLRDVLHLLSHSSRSTNYLIILATFIVSKIRWTNLVIFNPKPGLSASPCPWMDLSFSFDNFDGRINDIPMIHRGERESVEQEGKSEEERRFSVPRGCLQHCMQMKKAGRQWLGTTVGDLGPFVLNRKKSIRHERGVAGLGGGLDGGRGGDGLPALARAWHQRACPPPAPPSRHAYVLRVHTLTCHHRVETELIEVNLFLSSTPPPPSSSPPPCQAVRPRLASRTCRRHQRRRDVTPSCEDLPLESLSCGFSRPLLRRRFVCSRWISRAIRHGNSCRAVL